jgi:D-arabinose 1-dehydrogenase-like Zn-dependent alcohol dehydrogenase
MRAVQIPAPNAEFEFVDRPVPEPPSGFVRLRVEACGICHSDSLPKGGHMPGIPYPIVPGHEVVGVVDAVGAGVPQWTPGQRAGAGWNGGFCGYCDQCRRGDFFACRTLSRITGVTADGGYAQYMLAHASAVARVPDLLSAVDAAPLMCAGLTTFNALRHSGAGPGDLVAIHGLGGLGHLGVQFANKMGFRTVGIARGQDKAALARELGAAHYIDTTAEDSAKELQRLGGAKAILATVTNQEAMQSVIGGLGVNGTLLIVGAVPSLAVPSLQLLGNRQSVKGWYSGTSIDAEDTLNFAAQTGVRSMNEIYPLEQVSEAYARMMSGQARFRVVLTMTASSLKH